MRFGLNHPSILTIHFLLTKEAKVVSVGNFAQKGRLLLTVLFALGQPFLAFFGSLVCPFRRELLESFFLLLLVLGVQRLPILLDQPPELVSVQNGNVVHAGLCFLWLAVFINFLLDALLDKRVLLAQGPVDLILLDGATEDLA